MEIIYHVTTAEAWEKARQLGFYEASSLKTEGFIHCSTTNQVDGVLQRYFKDQKNLVKLFIDISKLTHPLKFEHSPSVNQDFPHIFGVINLDAVIKTEIIN